MVHGLQVSEWHTRTHTHTPIGMNHHFNETVWHGLFVVSAKYPPYSHSESFSFLLRQRKIENQKQRIFSQMKSRKY